MRSIPMVDQGAPGPEGAWLPLPEVLYIEPTNRCNSLCTECPRTFRQGVEAPRDLTLEEFDPHWQPHQPFERPFRPAIWRFWSRPAGIVPRA